MDEKFDDYYVKDISLAEKGKKAIEMTLQDMPGMQELERLYGDKKPLKGTISQLTSKAPAAINRSATIPKN